MDDSMFSGAGLAPAVQRTQPPPPPGGLPSGGGPGDLDSKGPGVGTWLVGFLGLLLVLPGIVSLVLAGVSHSKASASSRMWIDGNVSGARKAASAAGGLQTIAVLVSLLPLLLVFLAIFAVTFLGTTVEPAP